MKYSRLKTLLLSVDNNSSEEDILVNLNEEVALKLRSIGGMVSSNGSCTGNTGCSDNQTCQGQNGCSGNGVCNYGCDD